MSRSNFNEEINSTAIDIATRSQESISSDDAEALRRSYILITDPDALAMVHGVMSRFYPDNPEYKTDVRKVTRLADGN